MYSRDRCAAFAQQVAESAGYNAMRVEAAKSSIAAIFPHPVRLEPAFEAFDAGRVYRQGEPGALCVRAVAHEGWFVRTLKVPRAEKIEWARFEFLAASLSRFDGTASFEIVGNRERVEFFIGSSTMLLAAVLSGLWQAAIPGLVAAQAEDPLRSLSGNVRIFDLYPQAPYHHRVIAEKAVSPLAAFYSCLPLLDAGEMCFYQVLLEPIRHDWHKNLASLLQAEAVLGRRSPTGRSAAAAVKDVRKSLYTVRVRLGCVSGNPAVVNGLRSCVGVFAADGKPLRARTEEDFARELGEIDLAAMLSARASHCTGMLLSSDELASFMHLPDASVSGIVAVDFAKGFPVPSRLLQAGRPLGFNHAAGRGLLVRLPDGDRNKCIWLIGSSRKGKSNAMLHQMRWLIQHGFGVGFIDPHRVTAFELLPLLDENAGRVAFLDFDDCRFVLDYNIFDEADEDSYGRLSVEIVNSLKNLFDASGFHRMSHILGRAVYALFVLKRNLATIPVLLSPTPAGERLRREVASKARNEEIGRFWSGEFYNYGADAFAPILNRLSSLLMDDKALRVFSRNRSAVRIEELMNDGTAIVAAMPSSVETASLIGSMLIAQFQKAALARIGTPDASKPFFLFVDEFHRFSTGRILESIINETVKAGLHVCLANQETGQLNDELLKAVLSVPNILVFNVNYLDARKLAPLFNGKVSAGDILSLEVGEVFARLDSDIVDFRFPPPLESREEEVASAIVAASRNRFYTPLDEIRRANRKMPSRREIDSL